MTEIICAQCGISLDFRNVPPGTISLCSHCKTPPKHVRPLPNFFRKRLYQDQRGQVAILMVLVLPVIFMFFALALDAGVWFLDHRIAQNQVDASVLASVQHLPAADVTSAEIAAIRRLEKNGSGAEDLCDGYPQFVDNHPPTPDGVFDTVRVCVRRESPSVFAKLVGLDFIYISAVAGARVGPVGIANVLPWGVVPPDPYCDIGMICQNDYETPGIMTNCGMFSDCPWGLDLDKLFTFKVGSGGQPTPGNFGAIAACGGGVSNYRDCIEGQASSGFFEAGEDVNVGAQTGSGGGNTASALDNRYIDEPIIGTNADGSDVLECDVPSTPDSISGLDVDGKNLARARFIDDPLCQYRFVALPLLRSFPSGGTSEPIHVLGIATFGIANWDRGAPHGDPLGTGAVSCGDPTLLDGFPCGMVWGYLFQDVRPPHFLLQRIDDTDNPLAPLMSALVE